MASSKRLLQLWVSGLGILLVTVARSAENPETGTESDKDKSRYTIFNPTPKRLMREFDSDRPTRSDGPFTVDAGHFQFETDIVSYKRDRDENGTLTQQWLFNQLESKVGLTNDLDFEVITQTYNILKVQDDVIARGYGDTALKFKYCLYGNDGGPIALGVIPFVTIPTAVANWGDHRIEGGIEFPFNLALTHGLTTGFTFAVDKSKNVNDNGDHTEFVATWFLQRAVLGQLSGYIEFFSLTSNERGALWNATFDTGLFYPVAENVILDTGANIGVAPGANALNPFLGISLRF